MAKQGRTNGETALRNAQLNVQGKSFNKPARDLLAARNARPALRVDDMSALGMADPLFNRNYRQVAGINTARNRSLDRLNKLNMPIPPLINDDPYAKAWRTRLAKYGSAGVAPGKGLRRK